MFQEMFNKGKRHLVEFLFGAFPVLCMYYLSASLGLPSVAAIFGPGRQTKLISFSNFLYSPLFDSLLLALLNVFSIAYLKRRSEFLLLSTIFSLLSFSLFILLRSLSLSLFLFFLSSALGTAALVKEIGIRRLLIGTFLFLFAVELVTLFAVLSYFYTGNWSAIAASIIIRERVAWSAIEWSSIIIFALAAYASAIEFFKIKFKLPFLSKFKQFLYNESLRVEAKYAIIVSVFLATLFVVLPHLPSVNPNFKPISVDTFFYKRFLTVASSKGLNYALGSNSAPGARPIYLIALYNTWRLTNCDVIVLLDFVHPLVVLNLLVFSVYFTTKKLFDKNTASIAVIVTPISHAFVTFLAGGFQANSLALALALLLLAIKPGDFWRIFILSLLVALIHPWTFAVFSISLLIYRWRSKRSTFHGILSLAGVLVAAFVLAELIDVIVTPVSSPTRSLLRTASTGFSLSFPYNLLEALQKWTWASELNPVLLILASSAYYNPFMMSFFLLLAPSLLITNSCTLYRIILDIPLYIGASLSLSKIDKRVAIALILAMAVRSLEALAGLKPYEIELWERRFV